jgi:hypothetical protein
MLRLRRLILRPDDRLFVEALLRRVTVDACRAEIGPAEVARIERIERDVRG